MSCYAPYESWVSPYEFTVTPPQPKVTPCTSIKIRDMELTRSRGHLILENTRGRSPQWVVRRFIPRSSGVKCPGRFKYHGWHHLGLTALLSDLVVKTSAR